MVFYILIGIVFVAELIIAAAIVTKLLKLNRIFRETNLFLEDAKPKIKDISSICYKISCQLVDLAPIWVENIKIAVLKFILQNIKSMLTGLGIWAIREYLKKQYKLGL